MKLSTSSVLLLAALSGLVQGQSGGTNALGIPDCAVATFEQAIGTTNCSLTDLYCQCTTGAANITRYVGANLYCSNCSSTEVAQLEGASNKDCSSAVAAKGQTYSIQSLPVIATTCATGSGTVTAGSISSVSATTTAKASSTGAGNVMGIEGAVLAIAGLGALIV